MNDAFYTLRSFYDRFSSYKGRDLYLTGHAYAAVFQAYLAKRIIQHNEDPFEIMDGKINLKGLLLGNPCVLEEECHPSGVPKKSFYHYEFLYKRGFFTRGQFDDLRSACALGIDSYECYNERQKLDKFFNSTNSSSLNIYDKCYKTVNNSNVINSDCEDESGLLTYANQHSFKFNWHLNENKTFSVCNWYIW